MSRILEYTFAKGVFLTSINVIGLILQEKETSQRFVTENMSLGDVDSQNSIFGGFSLCLCHPLNVIFFCAQ